MKDKIFEIIIGAFKRKLICSDMVEMNKIAGGIDEATKAHYLPIIEKQDKIILNYKIISKTKDKGIINTCNLKILKFESELSALKDKLKQKP